MLGYGLVEAGKLPQAIAVLQWTAKAFPKSANASDSLADVLEKAGKREESVRESKKAHTLLGRDASLDARAREELRKSIAERIAKLTVNRN
jgi:predicted Zn-dependent protease